MRYRTGMYGGSFDPLHNGHLRCIIRAASQCETLYVVLSFSRARDRIPVEYRYRWIFNSFKHMDNIRILLDIKAKYYETGKAYNYFCEQFEQSLEYVFGLREEAPIPGNASGGPGDPVRNKEEKDILQSTVFAVANKIYLEKWIEEYAHIHFPQEAALEKGPEE